MGQTAYIRSKGTSHEVEVFEILVGFAEGRLPGAVPFSLDGQEWMEVRFFVLGWIHQMVRKGQEHDELVVDCRARLGEMGIDVDSVCQAIDERQGDQPESEGLETEEETASETPEARVCEDASQARPEADEATGDQEDQEDQEDLEHRQRVRDLLQIWQVKRGGRVVGEFSEAQIIEMYLAGELELTQKIILLGVEKLESTVLEFLQLRVREWKANPQECTARQRKWAQQLDAKLPSSSKAQRVLKSSSPSRAARQEAIRARQGAIRKIEQNRPGDLGSGLFGLVVIAGLVGLCSLFGGDTPEDAAGNQDQADPVATTRENPQPAEQANAATTPVTGKAWDVRRVGGVLRKAHRYLEKHYQEVGEYPFSLPPANYLPAGSSLQELQGLGEIVYLRPGHGKRPDSTYIILVARNPAASGKSVVLLTDGKIARVANPKLDEMLQRQHRLWGGQVLP